MQASVVEARNNFSAIVSQILDGTISECLVKRHDKPVVKIVPAAMEEDSSKRIGLFDGDPRFSFDYEGSAAMDEEIAREFGAL